MTIYQYAEQFHRFGDEIPVADNVYDVLFYAYPEKDGAEDEDLFFRASDKLYKIFEIVDITSDGTVICDLTSMIRLHQPQLEAAHLFRDSSVGAIMEDMHAIMAGYVSEDWMDEFATILSE